MSESLSAVKLSVDFDHGVDIVYKALLDIQNRGQWDSKLISTKVTSSETNSRSVRLEYLPPVSHIHSTFSVNIVEEWFKVSPSSRVIVVKMHNHIRAVFVLTPLSGDLVDQNFRNQRCLLNVLLRVRFRTKLPDFIRKFLFV